MTRATRQASRRNSFGQKKAKLLLCSAASLAISQWGAHAHAASGTWTVGTGGNYTFSDVSKWIAGIVPSGQDAIADFSHNDLSGGDTIISLDTSRTLGQLLVADIGITTQQVWDLTGPGVLTLSTSANLPVLNIGSFGGASQRSIRLCTHRRLHCRHAGI